MTDMRNEAPTDEAAGAPPGRPMMQWAVLAFFVSVVLTAVGTFSDLVADDSPEDGSGELVGWLIMMAVLAVVTVAVYRLWFEAAAKAAVAPNTVLIAGVLAAVTVMAFWSGLPAVFAVGALVLGRRGGGAKAVAGMVLAALALVVCVFAAIAG